MKAFINSLLTITVTLMLLELLFSFQSFSFRTAADERASFAIRYAPYYLDDVGQDVLAMSGDNLTLSRINATYLALSFSAPPDSNFTAQLSDYAQSLSSESGKLNANIAINYSRISFGNRTYNFSNGAAYEVEYAFPQEMNFTGSSTADLRNISMYYNSSLRRTSLTDFNFASNGSVYVRLNYTDWNGSHYAEGYLNGSQNNVFRASFSNGTLEIRIRDANPQLSVLRNDSPSSQLSFSALMDDNGTGPVSAYLPVMVSVDRQAYAKSGYVAVFRG